MKVTLEQIAKTAGTSISTVSNSLRNSGRVSETTKRRVIAIARELMVGKIIEEGKFETGKIGKFRLKIGKHCPSVSGQCDLYGTK